MKDKKLNGEKWILDCCLDLHMQNTGSLRLQDDYKDDVNFLERKLREWRASPSFAENFDLAVKNLIQITLNECKERVLNLEGFFKKNEQNAQ